MAGFRFPIHSGFGVFTRKPSPAMIVALLALIVALGGTSYAAVQLSKNSVLSKHIKSGEVKRPDLAKNAVASRTVARMTTCEPTWLVRIAGSTAKSTAFGSKLA